MLGRSIETCTPVYSLMAFAAGQCHQQRGMATLKTISMRLKSVKNIQKITQSMKMVSAAKYSKAERDLKQAKAFGEGSQVFYKVTNMKPKINATDLLYIAITSDRGLCGAVHSGVSKIIRKTLAGSSDKVKLVCVGDKSRAVLSRMFADHIILVANEVGRKPPTFLDAALLMDAILKSGVQFSAGKIVFNKFRSVVKYVASDVPLFSKEAMEEAEKVIQYEGLDKETMNDFFVFSLTARLYYTMVENYCSEQSSRMTAMDGSTKNAKEMISTMSATFNRTRQAVITRELIEIISGAAALEESH